jgi:hypothetical protein
MGVILRCDEDFQLELIRLDEKGFFKSLLKRWNCNIVIPEEMVESLLKLDEDPEL